MKKLTIIYSFGIMFFGCTSVEKNNFHIYYETTENQTLVTFYHNNQLIQKRAITHNPIADKYDIIDNITLKVNDTLLFENDEKESVEYVYTELEKLNGINGLIVVKNKHMIKKNEFWNEKRIERDTVISNSFFCIPVKKTK